MATYISLTVTAERVDVIFNALETETKIQLKAWSMRRSNILSIDRELDDSVIVVTLGGGQYILCSYTHMIAGCLPVEEINGVTLVSNEDLFTKMKDLLVY